MTTILSAEGLIEIPEVFRDADSLKPGQRCEIERVGHGEYRLRMGEDVCQNAPKDLIDLLRSCPVKDFFQSMDRSDTTDHLKPMRFE